MTGTKPRKQQQRTHLSKDGLTWRDMLKPDELGIVEKHESLIGANTFVAKWADMPTEVARMQKRGINRLYRKRQGKVVGCGRGGKKTNAKLDWPQVREIRASGDAYEMLAERYGVSFWTIHAIRQGRIWVEHEGEKYPRSTWLRVRRSWETRRTAMAHNPLSSLPS